MASPLYVVLDTFSVPTSAGQITLHPGDVVSRLTYSASDWEAIYQTGFAKKSFASYGTPSEALSTARAEAMALRERAGDAYDEAAKIMLKSFIPS